MRLTRPAAPSSLAGRILAAVIGIVVVTIGIGFALYLSVARTNADASATEHAADIAATVALMPQLPSLLATRDPQGRIQVLASRVRADTGASYVVVIDRAGIRYSHPNPRLIGRRIEEPVVALDGRVHTGVDNGSLGRSANVRVPIRDATGTVVGEVSVGILEVQVTQRARQAISALLLYAGVALGVGVVSSLVLARVIKRVTFGLEPSEIVALMHEREATLHGITEGLLATDIAGRITVVNDEARRLLSLPGARPGQELRRLVPAGRLLAILTGEVTGSDATVVTDGHLLILNRRPVVVSGRSVGAVVTVRDRTEIDALLQQLESIEGLTQALRAHQHEYSNRLHAMSVLLDLGEVDEARQYARHLLGEAATLDDDVVARVSSPLVAALLLAKATVAHERGVALSLTPDSSFTQTDVDVRPLMTVLGNLLDNAIDATAEHQRPDGRPGEVVVGLTEIPQQVQVSVRDNGPGIPGQAAEDVFTDGFTTKAPQGVLRRGVGLALVRRLVTLAGGQVRAANDDGAVFTAVLPLRSEGRVDA